MPTLALLLSLLLFFDPMGYHFATQYPVKAESPIIRSSGQAPAWASWGMGTDGISIDIPYFMGLDFLSYNDRLIMAACALPHEAQHMRQRSRAHELPLLHQYICMDQMGASTQAKEMIYYALKDLLVPLPAGGAAE